MVSHRREYLVVPTIRTDVRVVRACVTVTEVGAPLADVAAIIGHGRAVMVLFIAVHCLAATGDAPLVRVQKVRRLALNALAGVVRRDTVSTELALDAVWVSLECSPWIFEHVIDRAWVAYLSTGFPGQSLQVSLGARVDALQQGFPCLRVTCHRQDEQLAVSAVTHRDAILGVVQAGRARYKEIKTFNGGRCFAD